jgi:VanZ family protein
LAEEKIEMRQLVPYLPAMIQRTSIFAGWLALAFIVYATLSPIDDRPVIASAHLEHFVAFGLVGLAFALAYPNRLFLIVAIVVGSAFGLEALQLLTPDRHGRLIDALVKATGGVCGISAGQLMLFLLRTRFSRAG